MITRKTLIILTALFSAILYCVGKALYNPVMHYVGSKGNITFAALNPYEGFFHREQFSWSLAVFGLMAGVSTMIGSKSSGAFYDVRRFVCIVLVGVVLTTFVISERLATASNYAE
jgi:hypothetical protein